MEFFDGLYLYQLPRLGIKGHEISGFTSEFVSGLLYGMKSRAGFDIQTQKCYSFDHTRGM